MTASSWRDRFAYTFDRETEVPVTPKEFRKMFVTHLKDSGATEAELEAAAYAMHHSRQMQSKVYDEQSKANKMAPVAAFSDRTLQKVIGATTTMKPEP